MTETEWLASDDPAAMLAGLEEAATALDCLWPSDRKLRLWCLACRAASGRGTGDAVYQTIDRTDGTDGGHAVRNARVWADPQFDEAGDPTLAQRAALLREIVGNPFREVTLPRDPHCRACGGTGSFVVGSGEDAERMACRCCPWLTPTVLSLAQAAYKERIDDAKNATAETPPDRSPDRRGAVAAGAGIGGGLGPRPLVSGTLAPLTLAALADALEEAGCDSEDLLLHLRSPGPHVRGCWALDLILGRD